MNLNEAKAIYAHPNGHSVEELKTCLRTLNQAAQPVELNSTQFEAIVDAHRRLKKEVSNEIPQICRIEKGRDYPWWLNPAPNPV